MIKKSKKYLLPLQEFVVIVSLDDNVALVDDNSSELLPSFSVAIDV